MTSGNLVYSVNDGNTSLRYLTGATYNHATGISLSGDLTITNNKLTAGGNIYPIINGTSGEVLSTNGSGTLNWIPADSGPQGTTGTQGTIGTTGTQGTIGTTGTQGTIGTNGSNGSAGTQGTIGTTGTQGTSGGGGSGGGIFSTPNTTTGNSSYVGTGTENKVGIGTASPTQMFSVYGGNVVCSGNITAYGTASSDERLKTNIRNIENSMDIINNIRGVRFNWNENMLNVNPHADLNKNEIGLIAQELEGIIPEVVDNSNEYKIVNYEKIVPILIEALKEQNKLINSLNTKINNL